LEWPAIVAEFGIRESDLVLIHDGVRPFITETMILDTIQAVKKTGAATIATKITDTVKSAGDNQIIDHTIPRDKLWCVQTPQGFRFSVLLNAYARAKKMKFMVTDDAGIMEQLGLPVKLVPGSITNIKITTKHDIKIAETILKRQVKGKR
jgi:2-C-methyl-D-erythritol 4-phosphate cytidylyltransferase